jgi:hypothetical protein
MALETLANPEAFLATLGIGFLIFLIFLAIGIYIFIALALQTIAKRQKYKYPWFAWIPVLNAVLTFELGGFHWAWVFLYIGAGIPFIGILFTIALAVLAIISFWKIFEKEKYPGALALVLIVPIARLIILGLVAWHKPKKTPKKKSSKKKK